MKKRYRVTVTAVGGSSSGTALGSVVVEAKDRDAASRLGIEKLWKPDLEAGGARPDTHVERITGEGG
ncbi:MAG TPA: hypothetical protein VFD92_04040 [Candidatus Binatia bacterium]|nr:hypothetical protein [Candidatus Binatia bacterium]